MYQIAYAEALTDSPCEARSREREAIQRSIEYMKAAELAGSQSREAIVAVNFLRQLWTILIEDLASEGNSLLPELRAQIISIGIWVMRQAEEISMERRSSFQPIIEISELIGEGLK